MAQFFDKVFRKFVVKDHSSTNEKDTDFEMYFVKISFAGMHSKWFAKIICSNDIIYQGS